MVRVRAFAESRHFWTNPFVEFVINLWDMTTGAYRSVNIPVVADFPPLYHIVIEIYIQTLVCKVSMLSSICRIMYYADSAFTIHSI